MSPGGDGDTLGNGLWNQRVTEMFGETKIPYGKKLANCARYPMLK
jgi:hypothetical protein